MFAGLNILQRHIPAGLLRGSRNSLAFFFVRGLQIDAGGNKVAFFQVPGFTKVIRLCCFDLLHW
jgi:hypothetical protein